MKKGNQYMSATQNVYKRGGASVCLTCSSTVALKKKRGGGGGGEEILLWGEPKPPSPKVTNILKFGSLNDSTFKG